MKTGSNFYTSKWFTKGLERTFSTINNDDIISLMQIMCYCAAELVSLLLILLIRFIKFDMCSNVDWSL